MPVKKTKSPIVKPIFKPVKKWTKVHVKKKVGVKKVNKLKIAGVKRKKCPWNKSPKWEKKSFTDTFHFHEKKNTAPM